MLTATINVAGENFDVGAAESSEACRRATLAFLPSADDPKYHHTAKIKGFVAAAMRAIDDARTEAVKAHQNKGSDFSEEDQAAFQDAMRNFATALTHLETAKFYGVNGLHTRFNAGIID